MRSRRRIAAKQDDINFLVEFFDVIAGFICFFEQSHYSSAIKQGKIGHMRRLLAPPVLGFYASLSALTAFAAPDPNWAVQTTLTDCSGPSQQQTAGCESYATDFFEHILYPSSSARTADIEIVRAGFDADYYYFEYDFISPWSPVLSTGHNIVLEIDVDAATEIGRGDYYIGVFQKVEFNSTSWVDAFNQGGYDSHVDNNDDVGGAQPLISDFGGTQGDGYESDVTQGVDMVWARIVSGNFQIAIRRTVIGNPQIAYFRPWSRQSTSLAKDKLYFHDQNDTSDVSQIDNLCGVPLTTCIGAGPGLLPAISLAKNATTISDPINLTTDPYSIPGATVQYGIAVINTGLGVADSDSLVITDALPIHVSLRVVDFDAGTSGPVRFADGGIPSGLSYTFISLASTTDDVEFSDDGGSTYTYVPVPDAAGLDANVTHIRIRPDGIFQGSGASFSVEFKADVR